MDCSHETHMLHGSWLPRIDLRDYGMLRVGAPARQVQVVEVPWGGGADEAKLEEILKADTDKKIKAVAVVHNETTTGVTSDIGQVRQVSC